MSEKAKIKCYECIREGVKNPIIQGEKVSEHYLRLHKDSLPEWIKLTKTEAEILGIEESDAD